MPATNRFTIEPETGISRLELVIDGLTSRVLEYRNSSGIATISPRPALSNVSIKNIEIGLRNQSLEMKFKIEISGQKIVDAIYNKNTNSVDYKASPDFTGTWPDIIFLSQCLEQVRQNLIFGGEIHG